MSRNRNPGKYADANLNRTININNNNNNSKNIVMYLSNVLRYIQCSSLKHFKT